MLVYSLFEDDQGGVGAFLGVFSTPEKAIQNGKINIGTDIIEHPDGEYLSVSDVEEILKAVDSHVICYGDNDKSFHIIQSEIDKPIPLEE